MQSTGLHRRLSNHLGLPCPRLLKRQDYKYCRDHVPMSLPAPPGPPRTHRFCGKSTLALPVQHQCPSPTCSTPLSPGPLPSPATPGSGPQCRLLVKGTQELLSPHTSLSLAQSPPPTVQIYSQPPDLKRWLPWTPGTQEALLLGHLCPRGDRRLRPAWPTPRGRGLEWGQA